MLKHIFYIPADYIQFINEKKINIQKYNFEDDLYKDHFWDKPAFIPFIYFGRIKSTKYFLNYNY